MFVKTLLHDHVKLKANEIGRNFKEMLTAKIKHAVEGKCTRYGYVVPGRVDGASLNGDVVYEVEYQATVCNPAIGSIVPAKVVNVNRFGVLAYGGLAQPGSAEELNVLEIIVAKQGVALTSDVDLDGVRIGDAVQVQILGKRFELNDAKISIVGKVISKTEAVQQVHASVVTAIDVDVDDGATDAPAPSSASDVDTGSGTEKDDSDDDKDDSDEDNDADPDDADADDDDDDEFMSDEVGASSSDEPGSSTDEE